MWYTFKERKTWIESYFSVRDSPMGLSLSKFCDAALCSSVGQERLNPLDERGNGRADVGLGTSGLI